MVKVGDIVRTKNKEGKAVVSAVVTRVRTSRDYYTDDCHPPVEVLFADGTSGWRSSGKFERTGRHIDMQGVLDSIR